MKGNMNRQCQVILIQEESMSIEFPRQATEAYEIALHTVTGPKVCSLAQETPQKGGHTVPVVANPSPPRPSHETPARSKPSSTKTS